MPMKKKKGKPPNVSTSRMNAEIRKAEDKAREEGLSLAMALMLTVLLDKFGAEDHIEDVWHEVEKLSEEKGLHKEFALYSLVEKLAPEIIAKERQMYKGVSINVDFYSGFVYHMLDLPMELYTPIFAIARISGWSAHRMEELANNGKIIRPAYKPIGEDKVYFDMAHRK